MTARCEATGRQLIEECYIRSIDLLKRNSRKEGVNASSRSKKADERHYASIFGRDGAICSLGMAVSGDRQLIRSARNSLVTLAKFQARNGQIPKFVKPEYREVDFWYAGCIDATLWWLIAVSFYDRRFPGEQIKKGLSKKIDLALFWLYCQEHQSLYLLQQNEASDWADIMPRSGFVLYSNALWYHVKNLYQVPHASKTRSYFRYIFSPFDKKDSGHRRARIMAHYVKQRSNPGPFYLSFVNLSFWGTDVDVYANILSMLLGLSPRARSLKSVRDLQDLNIDHPFPIRVVLDPIRKNSPLWRTYMERHKQNFPYQYHNGGIWPYTAGFWIMLLKKLGKNRSAWTELERFAEVNSQNNWEFNEWFHGKTGKPMGMAGQSWNASMFILAYHCLQDTIEL